MNKQELIKKYKRLEGVWDAAGAETARQIFLQDLDQLDEPEKVKIPQFVADWYEERKNNIDFEIWHYLHTFSSQKEDEFKKWMNKLGLKQIQTLVNMHQFGYEVEEEKRYTVVMKETKQPLYYNAGDKKLFFSMAKIASHFTRQQLEKLNFSWVFDCEGIEIEEVED